jgi:Transposase IS66 family
MMPLRPLVAAIKNKLLDSSLTGADETTIPMVENNKKGGGKSKQCYLWVYQGDDKSSC